MRTVTLAAVASLIMAVTGCLFGGGVYRDAGTGGRPAASQPAGGGISSTTNPEASGTAGAGIGAVGIGKGLDATGATGVSFTQVMPWAMCALLSLFLIVMGRSVARAVETANRAVESGFELCALQLTLSHEREIARIQGRAGSLAPAPAAT